MALNLIKEACQANGTSLGPILVLSYKNHALDEFLLDILKNKNGNQPSFPKGTLIRAGKADNEELYDYMEQHSKEEKQALGILNDSVKCLRASRVVMKEFEEVCKRLDVIVSYSLLYCITVLV